MKRNIVWDSPKGFALADFAAVRNYEHQRDTALRAIAYGYNNDNDMLLVAQTLLKIGRGRERRDCAKSRISWNVYHCKTQAPKDFFVTFPQMMLEMNQNGHLYGNLSILLQEWPLYFIWPHPLKFNR